MRARPSVAEERRVLLAGRAQVWCRSNLISRETRDRVRGATRTNWRPSSLFSRIVFFFLTLVCIAAFYNLLRLTHVPAAGLITAVSSIGLAEFLILTRRFFHIGPEEALYLGGLSALVFDLGVHADQRLLLLAVAAAVAGFRVLNDFFFVAALVIAGLYVGVRTNAGEVAAIYCVAIAVLSLILLTRRIARPTWARTLASSVFLLPAAGFLIMKYHPSGRGGIMPVALAAFAILAAGLLAAGIVWRFHSAIFSALIVFTLLIADLDERLNWPTESSLLLWGAVALLAGFLADRALRRPRRGITSRRLMASESLDLLESAAIAGISAPPAGTPEETRDGGEFGGGGASGRY